MPLLNSVVLNMVTEYRPEHRKALLLGLHGPAIVSALQKEETKESLMGLS